MKYLGSVSDEKDLVTKEYVDILKNGLAFDEYLINEGSYTLRVSDMESGQWSYSRKADNTARGRTKYLIPVREGMLITYQNSTFDVFFGVLETPSSNSYIQVIGWQTNSGGLISITKNGYLTFVFRNHNDTTSQVNPLDFDSVVNIQTVNNIDLQKLQHSLELDENIDLIFSGNKYNETIQNVTFVWNDDKTACTLNGTNNSSTAMAPQYFIDSINSMPNGFVAGESYYVSVSTTNQDVVLGFHYYVNGVYSSGRLFSANGILTVPSTTTGMRIFIALKADKTANNDVISNLGVQKHSLKVAQDTINNTIDNEINPLINGYVDLLLKYYFKRNNLTTGTSSWTWNSDKTEVTINTSGFDTSTDRLYLLSSEQSLFGFVPGNSYCGIYNSVSGLANLVLIEYDGINQNNPVITYIKSGDKFTIASNTAYLYLGLTYPNTISIEDVVSDIHIYSYINEFVTNDNTQEINKLKDVESHGGVHVDAGVTWYNHHVTTYDSYSFNVLTYLPRCCTEPILIPESGLYVYYKTKAIANNRNSYRLSFWTKDSNGNYVVNNDYLNKHNITIVDRRVNTYIPYEPTVPNSYLVITYLATDGVYDDELKISYGKPRGWDNLPCLFPLNTRVKWTIENDVIQNVDIDLKGSLYTPNYLYSYCRHYGCILPVQYVSKVVCSPEYSLIAEIYEVDNNEQTVVKQDTIWSSVIENNGEFIDGYPELDFNSYDFYGYAIIGIGKSNYFDGTGRRNDGMGQLNKYQDCMKNVAIEWKEAVNVEHSGNIPSKAKLNIDTMCKYVADSMEFSYGSWIQTRSGTVPAMKNSNFFWYNGSSTANTPFRNVTLESLNSASKNRNSRLYKLYAGTDDSGSYAKGYGSTCGPMASLIAGLINSYSAAGLYHKMYDDIESTGIHTRDIETIEDLQVGDFITSINLESWEYGHVVYITDIVRINNVTLCAVGFEAYPPFFRYRPFINFDAFTFEDSETGLFSLYSSREIGGSTGSKYRRASRLDYDKYSTFRDSFGYIDDIEGSQEPAMIDRGTGSVYCIGDMCELSIDESQISSVSLFKNNDYVMSFNPGAIVTTINDLKWIDISKVFTTTTGQYCIGTAGQYFLREGSSTSREYAHFEVVERQSVTFSNSENGKIRIDFTKNGGCTPIQVSAFYLVEYETESHAQYISLQITEDEAENGFIELPQQIGEQNSPFDYCIIVYKTSDYTNASGHLVNHGTFSHLVYTLPETNYFYHIESSSTLGVIHNDSAFPSELGPQPGNNKWKTLQA